MVRHVIARAVFLQCQKTWARTTDFEMSVCKVGLWWGCFPSVWERGSCRAAFLLQASGQHGDRWSCRQLAAGLLCKGCCWVCWFCWILSLNKFGTRFHKRLCLLLVWDFFWTGPHGHLCATFLDIFSFQYWSQSFGKESAVNWNWKYSRWTP